jgi:hypothetical protein
MRSRGDLVGEVRQLLASADGQEDARESLGEVLAFMAEASGCGSVGIRWRAGEDYPYLLTRGFGKDFVVVEGPLCARDSAGLVLRHPDGTPQLACMCGAVITGRTDPSLPIFTQGGSFWTNGTTELIRSSGSGGIAAMRTRNYCNSAGYESVALIPLRTGGETLGLLQFNSRRPGRFTQAAIEEYEAAARAIAEALAALMEG